MLNLKTGGIQLEHVLTQVVLETVAGLVGVGESGVKGGSPVGLDLLLDILSHLSRMQTVV